MKGEKRGGAKGGRGGVKGKKRGGAKGGRRGGAQDAGGARVLHHGRDAMGEVFVVADGARRILRLDSADGLDQSLMDPRDPAAAQHEYVQLALAGLVQGRRAPRRALVLGLGGGSFPALIERYAPEVALEVVEHSPAVIEAARHMGYTPGPEVAVRCEDAARFLARTTGRYGLILVDAYGAFGLPLALQGEGFTRQVAGALEASGVGVFNLCEGLAVETTQLHSVREVFDDVRAYETPDTCNMVVFAGAAGALVEGAEAARRARAWCEARGCPIDLGGMLDAGGRELASARRGS